MKINNTKFVDTMTNHIIVLKTVIYPEALVSIRRRGKGFFSPQDIQTLCESHPGSYLKRVLGAILSAVKLPGREVYHSHLSSAKFRNSRSYTSTSQFAFMLWCLIEHRDAFTFTFVCDTS